MNGVTSDPPTICLSIVFLSEDKVGEERCKSLKGRDRGSKLAILPSDESFSARLRKIYLKLITTKFHVRIELIRSN